MTAAAYDKPCAAARVVTTLASLRRGQPPQPAVCAPPQLAHLGCTAVHASASCLPAHLGQVLLTALQSLETWPKSWQL